jgi:effector-binding domain-containing protein
MIDTPRIVETKQMFYAGLHLKVPSAEIRQFMGPGLQEVYGALQALNVTPAGPWFAHHFKRPDEFFDFEICVPLADSLPQASSRVKPGVWPTMRVAQTIHHGDYSGLPAAWGEFEAWIAAEKLHEAEDLWERYVVNPDSSKDPTEWRTELNRPLLD